MGTLLFGTQEDITCIVDVPIRAKDKGDLCLAYKTSSHFFGAGVYVSDDGYVLKVKESKGEYFPLDESEIREHQTAGHLPTPLPGYAIPFWTYAFGYSLWVCILAVILFGTLERVTAARKKARLERLRDLQPVSHGPPALHTKADRFVTAQVMPLLRPGEQVQHQVYGLGCDPSERSMSAQGVFGVLTSQRLFLIRTRVGAFRVLLENHGVEWFERSAISSVREEGEVITFDIAGGAARQILVKPGARGLSNQLAFLRDVPRLLTPRPSTAPPSASNPFAAPPPPFG